jgi:hypothetical protein
MNIVLKLKNYYLLKMTVNLFNGKNDNIANSQSSILRQHTSYSLQHIAII